MIKYIVKNCPARKPMITVDGKHGSKTMFDVCTEGKYIPCQDRTDCPIKQVVWFVKMDNAVCNHVKGRIPVVNNKVLQILQIEEME